MLDLLTNDIRDLAAEPMLITIRDTLFVPAICKAFLRRNHPRTSKSRPGSLQVLGELLVSGIYQQLGTIVNYQDTHWVAIVLDFPNKTIWQGDSLDWEMEAKLREPLEWWIHDHTSTTFAYKKMQVTHQKDTFSCGLLAWNALSHYFLPDYCPLIDQRDVAHARLKVLLQVCDQHCISVRNHSFRDRPHTDHSTGP
jgi:hypothetical protein